MVSKNEQKIVNMWQFYDKYRVFPFERVKIDITISQKNLIKLKGIENRSKYIDNLINSV